MPKTHTGFDALCPWCNANQRLLPYDNEDFPACKDCGKRFELHVASVPEFTTHPAAECPQCRRLVVVRRDGLLSNHSAPGQHGFCPGSKTPHDAA